MMLLDNDGFLDLYVSVGEMSDTIRIKTKEFENFTNLAQQPFTKKKGI